MTLDIILGTLALVVFAACLGVIVVFVPDIPLAVVIVMAVIAAAYDFAGTFVGAWRRRNGAKAER